LARQLHSVVISTKCRIVIGGIATTIPRFFAVGPNPESRVSGSEPLDQATFKLMNFYKLEPGCLRWISLEDRLLLLPNFNRTTLLHDGVPTTIDDEEGPTSLTGFNSNSKFQALAQVVEESLR